MTQPSKVWKVLDPEGGQKAGLYLEDVGFNHVALGTFLVSESEDDRHRMLVLTFDEWVEVAHTILGIAIRRMEEDHDTTTE